MTVVLRVEFPWGRYHANPWGRNVNEGHPEWPPSPWRVLRAIYSTWQNRCPHIRPADAQDALSRLSGSPVFHTPEMRPTHLRHYMPRTGHRSTGKPSTTLTFDPFAVIDPREPVHIEWDADMPAGPAAALEEIVGAFSYLGRSESICRASLVSRVEHPGPVSWQPTSPGHQADVEILCARQPLMLDELCRTPSEVRHGKRLIPRGSRLVPYTRTAPTRGQAPAFSWKQTDCTAMRWAVNPRPRPVIADAVAVGDLLRRTALRKHGDPSETLSGRKPSGERSLRQHQHAHYLSIPHRGMPGEPAHPIESLIVWAPCRLDSDEIAALARVKWLRAGPAASRVPDFAVAVTAFGRIEDIAPEIVGPSRVWESLTPFAPGRHNRKLRWGDHVRAEVARELTSYRGLPAPIAVTVLPDDTRRYRRHRLPPKETMGARRRSSLVRIQFDRRVKGPIALGSLSHFGLGLFTPVALAADRPER